MWNLSSAVRRYCICVKKRFKILDCDGELVGRLDIFRTDMYNIFVEGGQNHFGI